MTPLQALRKVHGLLAEAGAQLDGQLMEVRGLGGRGVFSIIAGSFRALLRDRSSVLSML